jgi:hypothetical protein
MENTHIYRHKNDSSFSIPSKNINQQYQQPTTNNHIQTLQIIFTQPYHSMQAARLLQFTVLSPISK